MSRIPDAHRRRSHSWWSKATRVWTRPTLNELSPAEFPIAWSLFRGFPYKQAFLHSVFEHKQRGRIFVDDKRRPKAGCLFHTAGHCLLAGDPTVASLVAFLKYMTPKKIIRRPMLSFACESARLERLISKIYGAQLVKVPRLSFVYAPSRSHCISGWRDRIPDGFTMHKVDEAIHDRIASELNPSITRHWDSAGSFVKHGIGCCLLAADGALASAWFSLAVGGGMVSSQTDTQPDYRGRGLATLVGLAVIEHCLQHGLTHLGECDAGNMGSLAMMKRQGCWRKNRDFTVYRYRG